MARKRKFTGKPKLDPFSMAFAEALIAKRKYNDRDVANFVRSIQKSPVVKKLFMKKGYVQGISDSTVFKLRNEMNVKPVGSYRARKGVGVNLSPATLRMVRNLVWAADLSPRKISKIMDSAGRPVAFSTVRGLIRKEGRKLRGYSGLAKERAERIEEFSKMFKALPVRERLKKWVSLNDALQALKAASSLQKSPEAREPLTERMSNIFELLEALEPLLPKEIRDEEAAEFLKSFEKVRK